MKRFLARILAPAAASLAVLMILGYDKPVPVPRVVTVKLIAIDVDDEIDRQLLEDDPADDD